MCVIQNTVEIFFLSFFLGQISAAPCGKFVTINSDKLLAIVNEESFKKKKTGDQRDRKKSESDRVLGFHNFEFYRAGSDRDVEHVSRQAGHRRVQP